MALKSRDRLGSLNTEVSVHRHIQHLFAITHQRLLQCMVFLHTLCRIMNELVASHNMLIVESLSAVNENRPTVETDTQEKLTTAIRGSEDNNGL